MRIFQEGMDGIVLTGMNRMNGMGIGNRNNHSFELWILGFELSFGFEFAPESWRDDSP
jgi:hypothetical protein